MTERPWWRRLLPTKVDARQIMEQMQADGIRLKEQPVAYHRGQAKLWQRHQRQWYALIATIVAVALLINSRWLTAFYVGLAFWIGAQWKYCRGMQMVALGKAWEAENEQTINAMHEGGLLTGPRDMLEVMRDADPPPGVSRASWRQQHEDLIKQWDERNS